MIDWLGQGVAVPNLWWLWWGFNMALVCTILGRLRAGIALGTQGRLVYTVTASALSWGGFTLWLVA